MDECKVYLDGRDLYIICDDIRSAGDMLERILRRGVKFVDADGNEFFIEHVLTGHAYIHIRCIAKFDGR